MKMKEVWRNGAIEIECGAFGSFGKCPFYHICGIPAVLFTEIRAVFDRAGAKCVGLGYCPEGEKLTCGRYPLKEQVLGGKYVTGEQGG